MTKKEKVLTLVLAGILLAYGWYQVAYGTNESSYQFGFNSADFKAGSACDDTDGDCQSSVYIDACPTTSANVTNQTACVDGFVNGWRSDCMANLQLCAIQVLEGVFPGHVDDNKMISQCYAKWDGNGFDANTLVLPTKLSTDPHGKFCPPIQGNRGS